MAVQLISVANHGNVRFYNSLNICRGIILFLKSPDGKWSRDSAALLALQKIGRLPEQFHAHQSNGMKISPRLAMNTQEFTPDDNSASKLNKSQIIGGFLFITDQQFTKAIEKRVCDLNDPTAGPEV